jgi:hypothetical protein
MTKMPTPTNDPIEVQLLLSVSGGGDLGPFFALLNLNRIEVEQLIRRADHHRVVKKLDTNLYQTTYFDYLPEFFEMGRTEDVSPEEIKQLEEIFEDERYPTDGIREAAPGEVPGEGTVRLDYCKLMIAGSLSSTRPDKVDFHWEACIKHTDVEITTAEVTEEVIRALLARLS